MKKKINKMMILIATVTILLTMVLITVVYYDLFRRQVLEDLKSYGLLLSNCSSVEEIEQSGVPVESDCFIDKNYLVYYACQLRKTGRRVFWLRK